jgi:hypothetical protein
MKQLCEYTGMSCRLGGGKSPVVNEDLRIHFKHTIHIPDNQQTSNLPPDIGSFPLKKVSDFANELPESMVLKGGLFCLVHREYFELSYAEA